MTLNAINLYLLLCFYILPVFATVLKIRAKKLSQINASTSTTEIISSSSVDNSAFFDSIVVKLNSISFFRNSLVTDINSSYNHLVLKNVSIGEYKNAHGNLRTVVEDKIRQKIKKAAKQRIF